MSCSHNKLETWIIHHCVWDVALIHTVHGKEAGSLHHTTHISIITGYMAYNFKEHPQ